MPTIDPLAITYGAFLIDNVTGLPTQLPLLGLQWEEQTGELAQRAQLTLPEVKLDQGWISLLVALGGTILIVADWGTGPQEMFRGTIWEWLSTDQGAPQVEITCYDNLMYLTKSQDELHYNNNFSTAPGGSASGGTAPTYDAGTIMRDVAVAAGVTIGGTEQLLTEMPNIVWSGVTYAAMFLQLLDWTYWLGGGAWLLRSTQGTISIVAPATNADIYLLTDAVVENYSDQWSMTDLITRVLVFGFMESVAGPPLGAVGGHSQVLGGIRNPIEAILDGHTEFGIIQAVMHDNGVFTPGGMVQWVKNTIANRGQPRRLQRFDAPDLPFLRRGDVIQVAAGKLNGYYVITGISHDADRKRMQITVDTSGDLTDPQVNWRITAGAHSNQPGGASNAVGRINYPG